MITVEEAETVHLPIGNDSEKDDELSLFAIALEDGGECFLAFFSQLEVANESAGIALDGTPFTYKQAIEVLFASIVEEEDCEYDEDEYL